MRRLIRPLKDTASVAGFMRDVLEITPDKSSVEIDACIRIRDTEILLSKYYEYSTDRCKEYRSPKYYDDKDRIELRKQILIELFQNERPINEADCTLGFGGFKPKKVKKEKKFFLVTGLPASGKSTISCELADLTGAYLVDNDYAKRKFPEFPYPYGASIVHDESQSITEGFLSKIGTNEVGALQLILESDSNIVFPKICHSVSKIIEIQEYVKTFGYSIYLVHIELPREVAVKRAYNRFIEPSGENRYVPLTMILDYYSDGPTLSYFKTKDLTCWDDCCRISTNVERHERPVVEDKPKTEYLQKLINKNKANKE